jgi:hypothetical protein
MAPPYNSVRIETDPSNGYEIVWLQPKGDLKLLYLEFGSSAKVLQNKTHVRQC